MDLYVWLSSFIRFSKLSNIEMQFAAQTDSPLTFFFTKYILSYCVSWFNMVQNNTVIYKKVLFLKIE